MNIFACELRKTANLYEKKSNANRRTLKRVIFKRVYRFGHRIALSVIVHLRDRKKEMHYSNYRSED